MPVLSVAKSFWFTLQICTVFAVKIFAPDLHLHVLSALFVYFSLQEVYVVEVVLGYGSQWRGGERWLKQSISHKKDTVVCYAVLQPDSTNCAEVILLKLTISAKWNNCPDNDHTDIHSGASM